ncbi:MAG: diguanylate cyclase, partial [Actinobacteria bacterium]|nr:diguanylate cyclase [Actinomycetota bacterium]
MSEEQRRWTWQPGMPVAARTVALAASWAALVMLGALAIGTSELHHWEQAIALALLGVSLAGVFVARSRADAEAQDHWNLLAVAFAASGIAQLFVIVGQSRINEHQLPSITDVAFLLFQVLVAGFFLRYVNTGNRVHLATHLFDALLLATALTFLLWELVLRHDLGELSRLSGTTQVLVVLDPFLDFLVFSLVVLLLLVDRSPVRVMSLLGATALAAGDVVTGGGVNVERGRLVIGGLCWILGVLALVIAVALPAGRRVEPLRPTLTRLAVVHGTVTVGLWVATWKYVLHDQPPTVVTVVIGLLTGLFWTSTQIAWHRVSSDWANRLNGSIVELQQTQDELRELLDDLPAAVVVLARDGRIREVNAQASGLTGLRAGDMVGRYFTDLFSADDRVALVHMWNEVHSGKAMENPTLTFTRPDGSTVLLEGDSNLPLRNPDRVVIALRDVTQRVMEANRLERARERFRLAFHGAPTGMALSSDAGGTILDVNESLVRMLGRDRDDLIGRTVEEISHPDDWQRTITMLHRGGTQDLENYRVERRYLRGDGGVVWARTWVSVMDDGDGGSLAISHIEDVTEQRHNEERLEWAATHDGLTGLPNRFRFLERLGLYLETAEPGSIAVLFIDLDNFKVINDSMGHAAGDQLLQTMSERLRSVVRDRDMLGRFGGDEFIVLLRDIGNGHNPQDVAERLRQEIARPMEIDGAELSVTASIGIILSDRPGITTSEMLRDADAAMYRAKARGRDCVEVFSPGSHDATVLTLRTTNELRRGLERGEIVP